MITATNMKTLWERYYADYVIKDITGDEINVVGCYIQGCCNTLDRSTAQRFTKPQALRYIMLNDVKFGNHKKLTIEKY